jgi:protein-disulfide isomerase
MSEAPQKKSSLLLILVALGLAVGGVGYMMLPKNTSQEAPAAPTETAAAPAETEAAVTVDVAKALTERVLGNPSATVKISEHSSLTCPHCAHFHRDTLPKLKAEYIDTGKAYLVFSDFPLNAPALKAGSLARCLPDDKYFGFIETLFSQQDKWAFEADFASFVKGKALETGLDEATVNACFDSKEIQDGLVAAVQASQKQWNINSTPTLVINNQKVISGSAPYEEIKKAIDEALGVVPASSPAEAAPAAVPATEAAPAAPETPAPVSSP